MYDYYDKNGNHNIVYGPDMMTIYGVENVVDVVAIGNNGRMYSIDLKAFNVFIASKNTGNSLPALYRPVASDTKPDIIQTLTLDYDSFKTNVSQLIAERSLGAWTSTAENDVVPLNDATQADIDSMESDPSFNKFNSVSQFFYLYNRVSAIDNAIRKGYKLFNPENFNHRNNWIAHKTDSNWNSFNRYLLVMYITKQQALLQYSYIDSSNNTAITNLINNDGYNISALTTNLCTSAKSPTATMEVASFYYAGDSIYSQNNNYRFVIQMDGDAVIYDSLGNKKWSTNTRLKLFLRPVLRIVPRGDVFMLGSYSRGPAKYIYKSPLSQIVNLTLTNSGILILQNKATNELLWISTDITAFTPNVDPRYVFEYNSSHTNTTNIIRHSPMLSHKLIFTTSGNLVLYRCFDNIAIWESGTAGNTNARLAIESNGNVAIYNEKNLIVWQTGTGLTDSNKMEDVKTPTILAVDDNGYVVIYRQTLSGWDAIWIRPTIQTMPFYTLASGGGSMLEEQHPFYFNDICEKPVLSELSHRNLLYQRQLEYCKVGNRMFADKACSRFYADSKNIDPYIANSTCSNDHIYRYGEGPDQQALNTFCETHAPTDTSWLIYLYTFIGFVFICIAVALMRRKGSRAANQDPLKNSSMKLRTVLIPRRT